MQCSCNLIQTKSIYYHKQYNGVRKLANNIVEIQIRNTSQLSDAAKREVFSKLKDKPDSFNFKGYAKVSFAQASPLRIISVDPIEGTINDYFKDITKSFTDIKQGRIILTDTAVRLVVARDVLFRLPEHSDRFIAFLRHWLIMNDTKAVATLSAWKEFMSYWEHRLKGTSEEIRETFFASMRGIVTPYRTKYLEEAKIKVETEIESMEIDEGTIVGWHYATVKFLITDSPEDFISKISDKHSRTDDILLTPRGLYSKYEIEDGNLVDQFCKEFDGQ